jgi:hypothetical protein
MAVDTLKQKMYDIKDIQQKSGIGDWWKYLLLPLITGISSYLLVHQKYQRRKLKRRYIKHL